MPKKRIEPGYRTTVTLPLRLHQAIVELSERHYRTLSAEMTTAVEEYVQRQSVEQPDQHEAPATHA